MKLEDVYHFFEHQPTKFINSEVAVCYVLHSLLQKDCYAAELVQRLGKQYPALAVSEAVLYQALKFLEREAWIIRYPHNLEGRGRPRQMFRLVCEARTKAQELARLWERFVMHQ